MKLAPFGNLHMWQLPGLDDPLKKIPAYRGTEEQYAEIISEWIEELKEHLWPVFDEKGNWSGGAAKSAEAATKLEVEICLKHLQQKNILQDHPDSIDPAVPVGNSRDHRWHYYVEDGKYFAKGDKFLSSSDQSFDYQASFDVGANIIGYTNQVDAKSFSEWFWGGKADRQPNYMAVKNMFQRPRPWSAATAFRIDDFVWDRADGLVHTGIHPAFPSGHCYQGIVHTSNALSEWCTNNKSTKVPEEMLDAFKQYAVDWGDRRVFAGVHYPTDNIASWIVAIKLLPGMYEESDILVDFAKSAIKDHSLVYRVVRDEYSKHKELAPAIELMDKYI